ncbi:hypothetical protein ZWY2020_037173 [Hordeum vulgare]|nr:hypothetical protein ZWY2020_037173 [Hordeum vulgare]
MTPHHRASMLFLMAASKGLLLYGGLLRAFPNSTLPYWNPALVARSQHPSRSGGAPELQCGLATHSTPEPEQRWRCQRGEGPGPALLRLETLLALGLDQRTTENALVNSKVTANLAAL